MSFSVISLISTWQLPGSYLAATWQLFYSDHSADLYLAAVSFWTTLLVSSWQLFLSESFHWSLPGSCVILSLYITEVQQLILIQYINNRTIMRQSACMVVKPITVYIAMFTCLIARWWVRPQTEWRHWSKLKSLGWCLILVFGLDHRGSTWFFSSYWMWIMSHFLCNIIVCLCDLIVSLWWYTALVTKPQCEVNNVCVLTTTYSRARIWRHAAVGSMAVDLLLLFPFFMYHPLFVRVLCLVFVFLCIAYCPF